MEYNIQEIVYDVRWSNQISTQFEIDYRTVLKYVFGAGSKADFEKQFIFNIFGPSVIVVAYHQKVPIAARALWRNDINGQEMYQAGGASVIPEYRGKGIYSTMTRKALAMLSENAIVYSFPNSQSLPAYKKHGWMSLGEYRLCLYTTYKQYRKEHPIMIDDSYAQWWCSHKKLYSLKKGSHYFLTQKDVRPFIYRVLGEISFKTYSKFPKQPKGIVFYKSTQKTWYNKRFGKLTIVCNSKKIKYVPLWKIDAI